MNLSKVRFIALIIFLIATTTQCNRKEGCPTFSHESGKHKEPKSQKRKGSNKLFDGKMGSYQNPRAKAKRTAPKD